MFASYGCPSRMPPRWLLVGGYKSPRVNCSHDRQKGEANLRTRRPRPKVTRRDAKDRPTGYWIATEFTGLERLSLRTRSADAGDPYIHGCRDWALGGMS